jgi:hypothetical protein
LDALRGNYDALDELRELSTGVLTLRIVDFRLADLDAAWVVIEGES